jgi:hypothetical protein
MSMGVIVVNGAAYTVANRSAIRMVTTTGSATS